MKIQMIACSKRAYEQMQRVKEKWEEKGDEITCAVKCRGMGSLSLSDNLSDYVKEHFQHADAFIFFASCGIAVRLIAPCITHKSEDPAVLVMDESGTFCIPILSGHAGGANELAEKISGIMGAMPVITTATDREGKFAADDFARKNQLVLTDWQAAKEISADILEGKWVEVVSDYKIFGEMPKGIFVTEGRQHESGADNGNGERHGSGKESGLTKENEEKHDSDLTGKFAEGALDGQGDKAGMEKSEYRIVISNRMIAHGQIENCRNYLQLIPKNIIAGIGCRKGIGKEDIACAVRQCLKENGISADALFSLASIELKKEEEGILQFCKKQKLDFCTFDAETLNRVRGDFTKSEFVKQITGVDNVCERSAAAAGGKLICKKTAYNGVTVSLGEIQTKLYF